MNKSLFGFSLALSLILLTFSGQTSAQTATKQLFQPKLGYDFKVGPFTTLVSKVTEGGLEENCSKLHFAIGATLRDMQSHMIPRARSLGYGANWDVLEVNQEALYLLCNKRVTLVLRNQRGDELLLGKLPFVRTSDPKTGDLGTMIFIGAAIISKGGKIPKQLDEKQLDEYGRIFMPDRLLPEK